MYKRILKWVVIAVVAIVLVPCILYGGTIAWLVVTYPRGTCSSVPFSPDKAGNEISCDIRIIRTDSYLVGLDYDYTSASDRKRITDIIGDYVIFADQFKNPGAPISLEVMIRDSSDKEIFNRVVHHPRANGHSSKSISSRLCSKELKPGRYRITVRSLEDSPAMGAIPTRITFGISNIK